MRVRGLLLVLAVACVPSLGANCYFNPNPAVTISQPKQTVVTPSFTVEVRTASTATFDPANDVRINGVPIPMTGGPTTWTALVGPGQPLQDHNVLEARATNSDGIVTNGTQAFDYLPPGKVVLHQITDPGELMQGPLAHGRVGDWLIANGTARFIVQDVGQRDLYSIGQFGGNLIDAELVGSAVPENFLEIQPLLNIETVINAQTLQVVNDGQDGTAGVLRTCGPDDLLDFVNPSSFILDAGLVPPPAIDDNNQPIEGCTEYTLAPGDPYVKMETTVFNNGATDLPLAVGDWFNAAGQLQQWVKPFQPGEALLGAFEVFSSIGYDAAAGVDYSLIPVPLNPVPPGAVQAQFFTTSGVSVILHDASVLGTLFGVTPPFVVPAGGQASYTRYLGVGDGSGSNGAAVEAIVKSQSTGTIEGCVTVGGVPLPGSRVSAVVRSSGSVTRMEGQFVTRAGGCPNYSGTVRVGTYDVAGGRVGAPYEGSLATPTFHPVTITAGNATTGVDIALPATGHLQVTVVDGNGQPVPARVSVVGFDPSPPQLAAGPSFPGLGGSTVALFNDPKDRLSFGLVAMAYTEADGVATLDVEPGSYQLFVSRGTEYSDYSTPITTTPGNTTAVAAQIVRVLDTPGFVSSDFHVHGVRSPDSRVGDSQRVHQFAGEGVENVIMTDHDAHTNLLPAIAQYGMTPFLTSTVGEEITTFDYGHFNGYPFTVDPSVPSGGSTDWAKPAPPGEDFPSLGAYNGTPGEIYALATTGPRATPDTTVQINHIDSHFVPLKINTSVAGPITDGLDTAARLARRLDPAAGNLFFAFPALELWNGANRDAQRQFLQERIGIWFNHLNKGLHATVISDTDTHSFYDLETAGARTWTASSSDLPTGISSGEVAQAVVAGRAVGGQGIYVQARLLAADGSGGVADLTNAPGASTSVTTTNGAVDLEIHVQAPDWADFDRIDVYSNAATTPVDATKPYLFKPAAGSEVASLLEGDCNPATTGDGQFDITTVAVGSATRRDVQLTIPFTGLVNDRWFVVVVRGTDGVCRPMFPVFPRDITPGSNTSLAQLLDGNVGESGVMALGVTNPLYADVDGVPGFSPPNP